MDQCEMPEREQFDQVEISPLMLLPNAPKTRWGGLADIHPDEEIIMQGGAWAQPQSWTWKLMWTSKTAIGFKTPIAMTHAMAICFTFLKHRIKWAHKKLCRTELYQRHPERCCYSCAPSVIIQRTNSRTMGFIYLGKKQPTCVQWGGAGLWKSLKLKTLMPASVYT